MLVTTIFSVVALTATATAGNFDTIPDAMSTITFAVRRFGKVVSDWHGDVSALASIGRQSDFLIENTKKGSMTASQSDPLSDQETLVIAALTLGLTTQVNQTLEAVIAAKPKFDHLHVCREMGGKLLEQKRATDDFTSEVVAKMPAWKQGTIKAMFQPIDDGYIEAIDLFRTCS